LIATQTTNQPQKSYVQLSELEHTLLKNAPQTIRGGQDKQVYGTQHKTLHALKKFNYIHFNTQDRLDWLIFDLDIIPAQVKNIDDMRSYISFVWELEEPTYILKTDKGYHIAYLLEWGVLTKENPKALIKYEHIRNAIGQIMQMDTNARRSHGIWRNPLKHEHYYSGIEYSLDDLIFEHKDLVNPNHPDYYQRAEQKALNEIVRDKTKSLNDQNKFTVKLLMAKVLRSTVNEKIIANGFRKSTIFQLVMLSAKKKDSVTEQELLDIANKYNYFTIEPLSQAELRNIAKSVQKYHAEGKIYVVNPTYIKDRGVMCLDYTKPLETRQKQGAEYTHAKRKERTKLRIQVAIKTLHVANKKINKVAVAKEAGVSVRTVQNYQDEYENALNALEEKSTTKSQNNSVQNGVICCLKYFFTNSLFAPSPLRPSYLSLNRRFKKKIKLMKFEKIESFGFSLQNGFDSS